MGGAIVCFTRCGYKIALFHGGFPKLADNISHNCLAFKNPVDVDKALEIQENCYHCFEFGLAHPFLFLNLAKPGSYSLRIGV